MSQVVVTILFTTYNGAKTLPAMLEALCRQTLWRSHWKLVAVDNNSTDATRAILDSFGERLPLTVVFEPRQGKEHALAAGFRHVEGDLLILTDDDVIPARDWIEQFLMVARDQPDFEMFSGLIEPEWEQQPESWLLQLPCLDILFALNGEVAEGPVPAGRIFGPNSAFRTQILDQRYVVHDNLGPNGAVAQYPMGQDTAFALRLERDGARGFHSRRPRLRHVVRAASMTEDWVLRRGERYGMGLVAVHPEFFVRKWAIAGLPVSTTLLWAAMTPVATALRGAPLGKGRLPLLWRQQVRQGILRQLRSESGRLAVSAARANQPIMAGDAS